MENKLIMSRRLHEKLFLESVELKLTLESNIYHAKGKLQFRAIDSSDFDITYDWDAPSWGNYFDIRQGEVSYKVGEQELTSDGKWKREGRQVCKASKLIAYIIQTQPNTTELIRRIRNRWDDLIYDAEDIYPLLFKKFTQRFLEVLSVMVSAKGSVISVSDDPASIYAMPTANASGCGTLRSSCMRPESDYDCRNKAQFYNDMGAKIAYSTVNGKLFSRAVLWEGVINATTNEVFKFMDRIYGSEETIEDMKTWAKENGYAYKVEQSYNNTRLILPSGDTVSNYFYAKFYKNDEQYYDVFPYIDTLYKIDVQKGIFVLSTTNGDFNAQQTDSSYIVYSCSKCGLFSNCLHEDNLCKDCAIYSELYQDYMNPDKAIFSNIHKSYIYMDSAILVENEYVLKDSPYWFVFDGFNYLTSIAKEILERSKHTENVCF
jgi:hypothetical protein